MVQFKLIYFDGPGGIAECCRLLLHFAQQPFEDIRYSFSDQSQFQKVKQNFFYGKLPVLEVDGQQLAQSATILRYLGEKFGLAGKDEWERAKANEIIDFHKDVRTDLYQYMLVKLGFVKGDLEQLRADVFVPVLARAGPLYERLLSSSHSGFFLASGLSMVDFMVADFVLVLRNVEPQLMGAHPELLAHSERIHGLPQLRKYLEGRGY